MYISQTLPWLRTRFDRLKLSHANVLAELETLRHHQHLPHGIDSLTVVGWWFNPDRKREMPILHTLAIVIALIAPTSVEPERVFCVLSEILYFVVCDAPFLQHTFDKTHAAATCRS